MSDSDIERLRAALEFYADPNNWWVSERDSETGEPLQTAIDADSGRVARAALGITPSSYGEEFREW